jgi:hypothetical protein
VDCHKENPCRAILNKQKSFFFPPKHGEQGGKMGSVWGLVPVGGGRYLESVKEAECSGNTMCSCMKMKK